MSVAAQSIVILSVCKESVITLIVKILNAMDSLTKMPLGTRAPSFSLKY